MVRAWPGLKGDQVTGYKKEKKINQGHPFVRTQDGFQCEGGRHALACLLTCWGASWQSLNLTTASALRLHFLLRWLALRPQRSRSPLSRRARIVGAGNEGAWRAGCVLSLSWKKKGKQLNLFPVFITKIWESGKSNCKHFVGETFWETYAPYTWRGIASPVGLLDPGLSIVFLRGGLLIATEILLPSTSMPSIFSTAWEAWVSSANSTYARPCRATQHKRVNTPTTSSCVWVEGSDH